MKPINEYLDAAVLMPNTNREEAIAAIDQCIRLKTKTVCVRPCDIDLAVEKTKGTDTDVSCVLSFPHGNAPTEIKAAEAKLYAEKGAAEIDMVANYGFIKSAMWDVVEADIKAVVDAAHAKKVIVKVIFETCYLTTAEIEKTVALCISAGADFVKTSTGFATGGATDEAVNTMLKAASGRIKVKPSGGIRGNERAVFLVNKGCHRLGVNYTSIEAICNNTTAESSGGY